MKTGAIWLLLIALAMLNGIVREKYLVPLLGQQIALPVSGIFLSAMIFVVTFVLLPFLGTLKPSQYWLVGGMWLCITVLFEFIFGRYAMGQSWEKLLDAYNVLEGNLWVLVLLITALSPYLAAKLRGLV